MAAGRNRARPPGEEADELGNPKVFFFLFFFCVTFCKCKLGRVQVPVPTADHGGGSRFTHGQGGGWAEEASVCKNLVSWRRASSTKLRLGGSSKKVAASARRR